MKPSLLLLYALYAAGSIVAVTPTNGANLYVSLDGGDEVGRFDIEGEFSPVASGLHYPSGLAFDSSRNLYVADYSAAVIRRISPSGAISTFTSVTIPYGLAFDSSGNLYATHLGTTANTNFDTISKITPDGTVSTFATGFTAPSGMVFDSTGNLYVANRDANTISRVTASGIVSTFATGLNLPEGLAFDASGSLYVANWGDSTVRRIATDGSMSTFVSSGLNHPIGIVFDSTGCLFVANYDGNTISKVTPTGIVSTFASGQVSPAFLAFEPVQAKDFNYTTNNGTITITGYTGSGGVVTIPSTIHGLPVTSIGTNAFQNCTNLTSIKIGNSITNIADSAFLDCTSLTGIYFQGNAPGFCSSVFTGDNNATVYYLPGTTGWDNWVSPPPAVLWNPQAQTSDGSFGVRTNQFGFNITGSSNLVIVVKACTDLANPTWCPVGTNTLNTFIGTNGTSYFSDPQWTNYPARYYRLFAP